MAGLFASMAVKWALDKLASFSFLPAAASSSSTTVTTASEDVELLRRLERTMRRIQATLHDAEEHWNIREESAKLRLKELKELAYAAEDVVEEYENEVDRCELEATAASVSNGKRKELKELAYAAEDVVEEYDNEVERCELEATAASVTNSKRKRHEENKTYSNSAGMVPVPDKLVRKATKIIGQFDEIIKCYDDLALSENDGERRYAPDISTLRQTSSVVYEKSIIGREEDKNKVVEILLSREGNNVACPFSVLAIVGMGGLGKTTLTQLVYNDPRVRQCFDVFTWVCVSEQFDVRTITKNIITAITENKDNLSERLDLLELADLQETLVHGVQDKKVLLVLDDVWNERRDLWELLCVPMSRTRICNIVVTTRNEAVAKLVQTMPLYRINRLSPDESWSLFKQGSLAVHQDNDIPKNLVEIGKNIVKKCKGLPLATKTLGSILRCETDEVRWRDVLESKLWELEESQSGVLPALELSYKHMPIYLKRCFVALSLFSKDYGLWESNVIKLWKSLDLLQCDRNGKEDDIGRIYINKLVQRSLLEVHVEGMYGMHDLIHDLACFLAAEEFFRIEGDTSIEIPPTVRYISASGHGASLKNLPASHSIKAIIFLGRDKLQEELPLNCKKLRAITCLQTYEESVLLPHRIGCGINLHTLPAMAISSCSCFCNISRLRSLNKIRELSVSGLCNVACIEDVEGAQLQSKKHLRSLALEFETKIYHCRNTLQSEAAVAVSHEQLLESLRPHHALRKLKIKGYKPQRYPDWVGNASYSNLTEVLLQWCDSQHLPTLGELPSLKSLKVEGMIHVEYIGREFCSHITGVKGFPSLTFLQLRNFIKLSEWSEVDVGEFPCLQTLSISFALKLRSLPPVPFMSLVTLHLIFCENLATIPAASDTLRELDIECCNSFHQLPTLVSLWKLEIKNCPKLSEVGSFPSLTTLKIRGSKFDDEKILYRLLNCHPSLVYISVTCYTATCIPLQPQSLPSLTKLHLHCQNLQYCDGLAGLTSLKELKVLGCSKLPKHSLPPRNLPNLIVEHFPEEWF